MKIRSSSSMINIMLHLVIVHWYEFISLLFIKLTDTVFFFPITHKSCILSLNLLMFLKKLLKLWFFLLFVEKLIDSLISFSYCNNILPMQNYTEKRNWKHKEMNLIVLLYNSSWVRKSAMESMRLKPNSNQASFRKIKILNDLPFIAWPCCDAWLR